MSMRGIIFLSAFGLAFMFQPPAMSQSELPPKCSDDRLVGIAQIGGSSWGKLKTSWWSYRHRISQCGRKTDAFDLNAAFAFTITAEGKAQDVCVIQSTNACVAVAGYRRLLDTEYDKPAENAKVSFISFNRHYVDKMKVGVAIISFADEVNNSINANDEAVIKKYLIAVDKKLQRNRSDNIKFVLYQLKSKLLAATQAPQDDLIEVIIQAMETPAGMTDAREKMRDALLEYLLLQTDYEKAITYLERISQISDMQEDPAIVATIAAMHILHGNNSISVQFARDAATIDDKAPQLRDLHRVSLLLTGNKSEADLVKEIIKEKWPTFKISSGDFNPLELVAAYELKRRASLKVAKRIAPIYPHKCARTHKVKENVLVVFDITPLGRVTNLGVKHSSNDCFNTVTLNTAQSWIYPVSTDGAPRERVTTNFRYDPPRRR